MSTRSCCRAWWPIGGSAAAARRAGGGAVWGGWWHWTLPLLPFLFWLERGIVTVPDFYNEVVAHEFLGRFTVGETAVHHNQAVCFYVAQLLARWTAVGRAAAGRARARRRRRLAGVVAGTRHALAVVLGGGRVDRALARAVQARWTGFSP